MKKLILIFLLFTSFSALAQSDIISTNIAAAEKLDHPLLIVNGAPSAITVSDLIVPNIAGIQVLAPNFAKTLYGNAGVRGAVVVTTKHYYVEHIKNEFSRRSKTYRRLVNKNGYHIYYKLNHQLIHGDHYQIAKRIYNIPTKTIAKIHTHKFNKGGFKYIVVNIQTKTLK